MAKKFEVLARITGLEKKYFDLVWIARHKGEKEGLAAAARVRAMYPEEVERLSGDSGFNPDWEHGFNSGCLAAFRLVLGLLGTQADAQMAEEEFPFLDT